MSASDLPAAGPADDPAVEVSGLTMSYADKTAVDDLSLRIERGTITAVLGPNGAGKTTTLETCEGYRRAQRGSVRVLGLDPIADRRALLPRIGVMLQHGGAWSGVRAGEMLRHIAALHAHPLDVAMLSDRLGLGDCGKTSYRRLSGGQQQRLGLAMALVGRPEVVFVDEPTAGMDPAARRTTWELLEEVRSDGVTVVLTTHYLDEAERLADQVHIVDRGHLVASGTPATLTSSTTSTITLVTEQPLPDDAVAALSGLLDGADVRRPDARTLTVDAVSDPGAFGRVSTWCANNDLSPTSLTVAKRSLEDVFLDLTGREPAR